MFKNSSFFISKWQQQDLNWMTLIPLPSPTTNLDDGCSPGYVNSWILKENMETFWALYNTENALYCSSMQTSFLQECAFILSRRYMPVWSLKLRICKYDEIYVCVCVYIYVYTDWEKVHWVLESFGRGGGHRGTKKATQTGIKIWNVFLFHYF